MKRLFAVSLLGAVLAASSAWAVVPTIDKPTAVLRALDKITARVEELDVPIGRPYKFGTLVISVRACRVTPPEDTPEASAFLEIGEFKGSAKETPVFNGWMFASSPALSAMEHPVYDLWVTGCKGGADAQGVQSPKGLPVPAPSPSPALAAPDPVTEDR